jgi:hypothetical protein
MTWLAESPKPSSTTLVHVEASAELDAIQKINPRNKAILKRYLFTFPP